jgi:hypothetical protein
MSEVRQLRPPLKPRSRLPQCQHEVIDQLQRPEWRARRYSIGVDDKLWQCRRESAVEVDGKPLCRIHAGLVLLDNALRAEPVDDIGESDE